MFALAGGAVVIGTMALAFYLTGSPSENRLLRMDEDRVDDLAALRRAAVSYHRQENELPESVASLLAWCAEADQQCYGLGDIAAEKFKLEVSDARAYQLCTTFERAAPGHDASRSDINTHGPGYQCFAFKVPKRRSAS